MKDFFSNTHTCTLLQKVYRMNLIKIVPVVCLFISCNSNKESTEDWKPLFNGNDLTGWDIKIKDHPLNDNYKNTFRVHDSILSVVYSNYEKFDNQFGQIYTKTPYSYYKLKFQYRFTGDHLPDAPDWSDRNSGVMIHSQSAQSMELHQNFPVSLEFQLLCGNGNDTIHTGNVCTPGTFLTYNGEVFKGHIKESTSKTYLKNEWVSGMAEVYGDSLIRHIVNGDTVLTYTKPMIGEGFVSPENNWAFGSINDSLVWINKANTALDKGFIALQAESQPVDFKNIYLLNFKGCMDKKATNYKSYYLKADNKQCKY